MRRVDRFDPHRGLIVVPVRVAGPQGDAVLQLALDTGATRTILRVEHLIALGYNPTAASDRIRVTTAGGVRSAPMILIRSIAALGRVHRRFPVLGYSLPPSASVDGLLGLDFLRGKRIVIDLRKGKIALR